MNNFKQKNTQENIADNAAINEAAIKSYELYEEIIPLIEDYFVGDFTLSSNEITMNFLNGQKFRLSVEEVSG